MNHLTGHASHCSIARPAQAGRAAQLREDLGVGQRARSAGGGGVRQRGGSGEGALARADRIAGGPRQLAETSRAQLGALGEALEHIVDEQRAHPRIAVVVAGVPGEREAQGRPRDRRVEQPALSVERVLAQAQADVSGRGERETLGVSQERIGRRAGREHALLQAGEHQHAHPPRAQAQRIGDRHGAGMRRLAETDLLGARAGPRARRAPGPAPRRPRRARRARRSVERTTRSACASVCGAPTSSAPRCAQGAASSRRASVVRRSQRAGTPRAAASPTRSSCVQRKPASVLPGVVRGRGVADAGAAHALLERVGEVGLAQHAGRAQPAEQVVGRPARQCRPQQRDERMARGSCARAGRGAPARSGCPASAKTRSISGATRSAWRIATAMSPGGDAVGQRAGDLARRRARARRARRRPPAARAPSPGSRTLAPGASNSPRSSACSAGARLRLVVLARAPAAGSTRSCSSLSTPSVSARVR